MGGLLSRTLPRRERRDSGGPTVAHHIQCGGERSGPTLRIIGVIKSGWGGSSSNNGAAQPVDRTIQASNYERRRTEEVHMRLKLKAEFFYADNRMVASTNPGCL